VGWCWVWLHKGSLSCVYSPSTAGAKPSGGGGGGGGGKAKGGRKGQAGRWKGGRGARPPPELLKKSQEGGRAAAGAEEGAAVPPEVARIVRDRERFAAENDLPLVEDQLDMDYDFEEETPEERECMLCHRVGNCDPVPGLADLYPIKEARQGKHGHLIDPRGIWMSSYPLVLNKTRSVWVHRLCALFCPRACIEGSHRWFNVAKEVRWVSACLTQSIDNPTIKFDSPHAHRSSAAAP
jgi:hypothetical protein